MWVKYKDNILEQEIRRKESTRSINLFFCSLIVILFLLVGVRSFVFSSVVVNGSSMDSTLTEGDILLVNKLATPKRGDIIVFYGATIAENGEIRYQYEANGQKTLYIKRLIAIPGDTVYWSQGKVSLYYVTEYGKFSVELIEPYAKSTYNHGVSGNNTKGTYVTKDKYFVMGDNRWISNDSRGSIGLVDTRLVLGVVPSFVVERKDTAWSYLFRSF